MAPTTLSPAYPVLQKLCDASAVLEKPLRWCGNIGVVFFFLMVVITFTDVFLRYFLGITNISGIINVQPRHFVESNDFIDGMFA